MKIGNIEDISSGHTAISLSAARAISTRQHFKPCLI